LIFKFEKYFFFGGKGACILLKKILNYFCGPDVRGLNYTLFYGRNSIHYLEEKHGFLLLASRPWTKKLYFENTNTWMRDENFSA
jgi:hypothetical protein